MTDNIDNENNGNGNEKRRSHYCCYHEFNASELVAAMAPVEAVLKGVASTETIGAIVDLDDTGKDRPDDEESSLQEQDCFARIIKPQWESDHGPSLRYLAHLVGLYVKNVGEDSVQSEELLDLLLIVMSHPSSRHNAIPNPCESCHISFHIPRSSSAVVTAPSPSSLLRIRIYPQHNDVALRLWEAGAFLAEYLMEHPEHVADKRVVELGSGVGATGLVIAGCCGAQHVCCTDFTDACLVNLRHNININEAWLREKRKENGTANEQDDSIISSSFLDWGVFDDEDGGPPTSGERSANSGVVNDELSILRSADVLIAADVVYDQSAIPSLVRTVRAFLSNDHDDSVDSDHPSNSNSTKRTAIFTSTRRNRATFDIFQDELKRHGIRLRLLASGEDCMNLPLLFPTKFNQPRSDGNIWELLKSN